MIGQSDAVGLNVEPRPPGHFNGVYRCYDHQGNSLYVGMGGSPFERLGDHRRKAPWWPLVDRSRTRISWHRTRRDAYEAEREAIRTEKPAWNKRAW